MCGEVPLFGDAACGRICEVCETQLTRVKGPFCMRCGKPFGRMRTGKEYCADCAREKHLFTQGRAVFVYRGAVIGAMHRFKYSNRRDYAPVLAREAYRTHADWLARIAPDVIVPVPLYPKRQRARGYNQAELLARELSELSGIPMEAKLLRRVVHTQRQKELSASQRKNNLKNAFQISKKIVQSKKVLLIDDIYTTGSTADAAAAALLCADVQQVYLLCICIGEEA